MHASFNAGNGDIIDVITSLFCTGKFNDRLKEVEKLAWRNNPLMLFQKSAWDDVDIMIA